MHPVIRILCVLLLAAFLARGEWPVMAVAMALLLAVTVLAGSSVVAACGRGLLRIRWLLLALLLAHLWTESGAWNAGLERAAALALMAFAVGWLSATTPVAELAGSLYWLLQPFSRLGLPAERLSLRLALVLDCAPRMSQGWLLGPLRHPATFRRLPERTAGLLRTVLEQAEQSPLRPVELRLPEPPTVAHWTILVVLTSALTAAQVLA